MVSPEKRHGGALVQPSARKPAADLCTLRWCVGKRSVIVKQARDSESYQKKMMKIKETPNKDRYTISKAGRCHKQKWYLIQN